MFKDLRNIPMWINSAKELFKICIFILNQIDEIYGTIGILFFQCVHFAKNIPNAVNSFIKYTKSITPQMVCSATITLILIVLNPIIGWIFNDFIFETYRTKIKDLSLHQKLILILKKFNDE